MRSWFKITASATDSLVIDITDEIGYFGVSARDFAAALKGAGKPKNITLNLDCPGGDCNDGFTIFDALKNSGAAITVNITGLAASMASVIMLAGDKIKIAENGRVMIHRVTGGAMGNADEMDAAAKVIKQFEDRIVGLYMERTKKDETAIRDLMKAQLGTWFFGQEAVDEGFADELIKGTKARAFRNEWAGLFTMLPAALFDTRATSIPAALPDDSHMKNLLLLLAAAQGITIKADATDAEIEAAITAHKPAPQKFEMNLEDPETKTIFDTAVTAGITAALPAAVKAATDPLEKKIADLSALITNGVAGGAAGGTPLHGASGSGTPDILAQLDAITDASERTAFFQKNKAQINAAFVASKKK